MSSANATTQTALLQAVATQLCSDNGEEFVGRDFVRTIVCEFLSVGNRMLVFVGPPGIGKTALAAALVRENAGAAQPYLAHFCELNGEDNPFRFCSALAQQLHARLGDDYVIPETVRGQQVTVQASVNVGQASGTGRITALELNIGGMHPREAFRQLVREPLRAYQERHGAERHAPLVIVIDALDRAWEWDSGQGGNIISALADVQDLPPWVNLICTARPGPAVQALRVQAGVRVYDIAPQSRENLDDIATFFRERFLAPLDAQARARFDRALADAGIGPGSNGGDPAAAFVRRAVEASQGNFRFVRHYVDAWRAALAPVDGQPAVDPAALLRFEAGGSLDDALDATYAAIYDRLDTALRANTGDADEDVLAALAIAFAPLHLPLLTHLSGRSLDNVSDALGRLAPVLAQHDGGTYSLYHSGFADYVRRHLPQMGRARDVRAAQTLEHADMGDPLLREYRARFRWPHLLRGLDLAAAARDEGRPTDGAGQPPPPTSYRTIAEVQAQVQDAVTQAQLLRELATRALDPNQADATGSWNAALSCLHAAERTLRRSRALLYTRQRVWTPDTSGSASPELIELEHTLIALGDAYATIARRMDAGGQRPVRPDGPLGWPHAIWDATARLPLTLYLLLILWIQGVRELHIPGALQNLGRAQDWTVARLCVLSVSAYRRARTLAGARGADDADDDVAERLGQVYMHMGAYDAAAATYEMLLARPTTITRIWLQAVWRLALGEVLLIQQRLDRAAELLNSALPIFVAQQAPVLRARALSALASAHRRQAEAADARRDRRLAAALDDLSFADCEAALAAWADVTTLPGDETASVDPALATSRIAHWLWRAGRDPRLGDEQQRRARTLLDTIAERHYPQRFEHPVLHFFRIAAAVLLPAYVLVGLLLAVQRPSDIQVRTRPELSLQPPLLDLARFPNNLVGSRISAPDALSTLDLTQLATNGGALGFLPSTPSLDPLAIIWVVLLFIGLYLVSYTLAGLTVIIFTSPAQFQSRRPGRLVLDKRRLHWRGPASQGSLLDTWDWFWQDMLLMRGWMQESVSRVLGTSLTEGGQQPGPSNSAIGLDQIESLIVMDRRALGYLLHDFSFVLAQPRDHGRRPLIVPGSLFNYEELCDELERRSKASRRHFGVEFVRSTGGFCFMLTLLYALLLVLLLPLNPSILSAALPGLGYSLSSLYILVTPGLLLPLLWWFVAHPLGASITRSWVALPLAVTAAVGSLLTVAALGERASLAAFGLKPDLATPIMATGVLAALLCHAPPRPLLVVRTTLGRHLLRLGLGLLALVGLGLLTWQIGTTLVWYNALVQGNQLVEQALRAPDCTDGRGACAAPDEALAYYDRMICLRPNDSDGYAFRGFAYLSRGEYEQAIADFERAQGAGQPPAMARCALATAIVPRASQRTSLYTNIGAVETLIARRQPLAQAEPHYAEALRNYARAMNFPHEGAQPECAAITGDLLQLAGPVSKSGPAAGAGLSASPRAADAAALNLDRAPVITQLADTCYSRGFARLRAYPALPQPDRDALRQAAWDDLVSAAAGYHAVLAANTSAQDDELARRGLAATWLALSQFDALPPGAVDRRTYLLRALTIYQELEREGHTDVGIYAGQAWSAIQLGAWDTANAPLAQARALAGDDPAFPALQGLVAWLNSTQYPAPRKGKPSPGYTGAILRAVDSYTTVINQGQVDLDRAYATRSLLFYSLRNSPHGPAIVAGADDAYADADYGAWMRQAIGDVDQALIAAEGLGRTPAQQVGYRYWRGRLSFALALTWQEKFRGPHEWSELVPLYSRAFDDFSAAAAIDPNAERRAVYTGTWIPWARVALSNASHMHLAQMHARRGDFDRARAELELVDPRPAAVQQWDRETLSAPRPDYSYLHGLISLGLGLPDDFPNKLIAPGAAGELTPAELSYTQAITETENRAIVAQPNADYPDDARPMIYEAALKDLEGLLDRKLAPEARAAAERVRERLRERLAAITD